MSIKPRFRLTRNPKNTDKNIQHKKHKHKNKNKKKQKKNPNIRPLSSLGALQNALHLIYRFKAFLITIYDSKPSFQQGR